MLQWLHARACPWDKRTCVNAAEGGRLEVLLWLRANGCEWNKETCLRAAEKGHLDVLGWAHANGCPWDIVGCVTLLASHVGGDLCATRWLRKHGFPEWMMWMNSSDEEWIEDQENGSPPCENDSETDTWTTQVRIGPR